jgi:hypothetical protein
LNYLIIQLGIESEKSFINIKQNIDKYFNSEKVKYIKLKNIKFHAYSWPIGYEIIIELINQPKHIESNKIFGILCAKYNICDFSTKYKSCISEEFTKQDLTNYIVNLK